MIRMSIAARERQHMISLEFTNRQRYCKALRRLWACHEKYMVVCHGKNYEAWNKAPRMEYSWYIDFYTL